MLAFRFACPLLLAAPLSCVTPTPSETGAPETAPDLQSSQDEMMKKYMELAAPGPKHEFLKVLAGQWKISGKFRMTPDAPWEENKGESTAQMILGRRFLEQRFHGEPMASMPTAFDGLGFLGYDNQKQKYVSAWMDSMGTMILTGEGTAASDGKTLTLRSDFIDPMTNQPTYMIDVYRIESDNRYVLVGSGPGPDGKEFEMMELVHERTSP